MEQNHLEFTDFEKAALIYNAGLPVLERLELLEQLAEKTEDESLRGQIHARLVSDRQELEVFWNNTEGYVYAVELCEDDDDPYIGNYYSALVNHDMYGGSWPGRIFYARIPGERE